MVVGGETRVLTNDLSTDLASTQKLTLRFGQPAHRLRVVAVVRARCVVTASRSVFTALGAARLDGETRYSVKIRLSETRNGRFSYSLRFSRGRGEVVAGAVAGVSSEEVS